MDIAVTLLREFPNSVRQLMTRRIPKYAMCTFSAAYWRFAPIDGLDVRNSWTCFFLFRVLLQKQIQTQ
jgi:hypothetical protein